METKRDQAIRKLDGKDVLPIVRVFFEFNHLKSLYRQGWLRAGIPKAHCETVAEHSLGVAVLALFLADAYFPELDTARLVRMGLLHDFGEIYAGDIVPGKLSLADKHELERQSVECVFGRLPNGADYLAIWEEFERGETAEARFLKEIDRLEMGLQASVYEQEGFGDLALFFESTDRALTTPELRQILEDLKALRPGGAPEQPGVPNGESR
ncbi:MAG: HD domain-containing protein [Kiritimatiellae bacterium]|jgi:putative hydrolase of HD superfamily|nr:HD domain-containing protein [Kiritimatiellia bacterium]MDD4341259.1 HD domain-containing protein [Kiritimatiellia bacterium]